MAGGVVVGAVVWGAQRRNHHAWWWDTRSTPNQTAVGGGTRSGIHLGLPPGANRTSSERKQARLSTSPERKRVGLCATFARGCFAALRKPRHPAWCVGNSLVEALRRDKITKAADEGRQQKGIWEMSAKETDALGVAPFSSLTKPLYRFVGILPHARIIPVRPA
jgi:hypothetical protein